MSEQKFLYSERVAPALSFDLVEIGWSAVSMVNQFFRSGTKETKVKLNQDEVKLNDKDHHIYCVMEIDHKSYQGVNLGKELAQLNSCEGFKESIEIDGDSFDFKAGARIRISGTAMFFDVASADAKPKAKAKGKK